MEYISEVDEYLVACAEQIKAMWQEFRQYGFLSEYEESERLQYMEETLAEILDEWTGVAAEHWSFMGETQEKRGGDRNKDWVGITSVPDN